MPRPPTFDQGTPELRGWYCYEIRRKRKDKDYLGMCSRTLDACQYFRDSQSLIRGHVSECRPRQEAACFRTIDLIEREDNVNCYTTLEQCIGQWAQSVDHQPERLIRTQCEVYP